MAKKDFNILSFMVCDDIRHEANGKEIIIGAYSKSIIVRSIPTKLRQLVFRIILEVEQSGTRPIYMSIVGPDKKKFVASILSSFNEFLGEDKRVILQIDAGTDLNTVSESLRAIADIIECAQGVVKGGGSGDEDEDSADWWKKRGSSDPDS